MRRGAIGRRPGPAVLLAVLLAACGGADGPPAGAALVEAEDVRLEGRVTETDATPMFVDGDGLIYLDTRDHGAVVVRVPARERRCPAEGLDLFTSLGPGDSLRVVGRVTGSGEVTVCADPSHVLAKPE